MGWNAIVHDAVWKELPAPSHDAARAAMRALTTLRDPGRGAGVRPLEGSSFEKAYRLRVGRSRVLFIVFPDERTIAFITAFVKKRDADYAKAVQRFDSRVRAYE